MRGIRRWGKVYGPTLSLWGLPPLLGIRLQSRDRTVERREGLQVLCHLRSRPVRSAVLAAGRGSPAGHLGFVQFHVAELPRCQKALRVVEEAQLPW